jgi:hypothetical protein
VADDGDVAPRRRAPRRGSGAYGLLGFVALIVDAIVGIVSLLLIIGILFVVLEANPDNGIVNWVLDAAKWLAGPFDEMFTPKDHKLEIALNWGIALVVYVIVGRFIASLLRRRPG